MALDKSTLAYNACLAALAEAEQALEQTADTRARAWAAAEALFGHGRSGHGSHGSKAEVRIKANGAVVWR